jgi:methionyl-tRNA formyltransferase
MEKRLNFKKTPQTFEKIADRQPDLILVIAFGQKVGNDLIRLPPKGAINVHASLLPKYRGAAPINWAIVNGETETGVSIITLAEKMDAGDILAQTKTAIGPQETAGELHDRLAKLAAPLLIDTLGRIENGTAAYGPQDHSRATLAPKIRKSDGALDFNEPAELVARKIRGFWPWPGASADYISKATGKTIRVTIAMAEPVSLTDPPHLPPGTLDENLNVICGQDLLRIRQLRPAGSGLMSFRAFANGRQTRPGDRLVQIEESSF